MKRTESSQKDVVIQTKRQWVRLTQGCNNRCIFCLDKEAQNGSCIGLKDIKANLAKGIKLGSKRVVLSGGEPTIHPEFLRIVRMARELGYNHIQVISNGRMFAYPGFLREAVHNGVSEITFSMHGHNSALHDRQTRVPGSFRQSLAGLANALKIKDLIVSVDVVVNKMNVEFLPAVLKFFVDLGVREFDLLQVIPFGSAWGNWDKLFYDLQKTDKYLKQAFTFSKNPQLRIWTNRFPPEYLEDFEDLIQDPVKLYDEIGGRREMFERFLKKNVSIPCRGDRCQYCILKDFCDDLVELKNTGELASKSIPPCLKKDRNCRDLVKEKKYYLGAGKTIFDLLDFYISHRYFLKSLRCKSCRFHENCDGMYQGYIRKFGFKNLLPLAKKGSYERVNVIAPSDCRFKCIFCFHSLPDYREGISALDQKKLKKNILEARKNFMLEKIFFSGADILSYPLLPELISYVKKIGFEDILVNSNGVKLANKMLLDALLKAGVSRFDIPIYGHNERIHDSITGSRGSFRALLNALDNLKKHPGVGINLHTIVLKQNYSSIARLYSFVRDDLKINNFYLRLAYPRNDNPKDYSTYCPSLSRVAGLMKKDEGLKDAKFQLPFCLMPDYYLRKTFSQKPVSEFLDNPNADEKILYVSQDGIQVDLGSFEQIMMKPPKCGYCKLAEMCEGVFKSYTDIYTDGELRPFASLPPFIRSNET